MLQRIQGSRPPTGTGPLGAPDGKRWVSASDVLVWNARVHTEREHSTWDSSSDPLCTRTFRTAPVPLRDYQMEAYARCVTDGGVFHSGTIEMSCGSGKSHIMAAVVQRSAAPAVILAPHSVCVDQWVELMRTYVTNNVVTLGEAKRWWKIDMELPDVLVMTYHSLVRVTKAMNVHRQCLERGDASEHVVENSEDRLLMMLMCERFGVLVMDEVHMAVADYFISACRLRSSAVYGLSGSLVREDDRIGRLVSNVGPSLFRYIVQRDVHVCIVRVDMSDDHRRTLEGLRTRSKYEQAYRALNPYKVYALDRIIERHSLEHIVVFCDIKRAAEILHSMYSESLLMTGRDTEDERDVTLSQFKHRAHGGVLICTRVCDASINFPRCVVVQYHVSCGSRQVEVQRCGRGTRDLEARTTFMYHIVNRDSEEVDYVARRVSHLSETHQGTSVTYMDVGEDVTLTPSQTAARDAVLSLTVTLPRRRVQMRRHKNRLHGVR